MGLTRKRGALGFMFFTSVEIIPPFGNASQAFWWFHLPILGIFARKLSKYVFLLRKR